MTDQQDEDALFDRLAKNLEAVRQDADLVRSRGVEGMFDGVARIEVELRSLATSVDALRQGFTEQRGVTERLEAAAAKQDADLEQLRQTVNALSGRVRAQAEMLDGSSSRKLSGWVVAVIVLVLVVLVLGGGAAAWTASGREPSISELVQRLVAQLAAESAGRPVGPGAPVLSERGATGMAGSRATLPLSQAAPASAVSAEPAPSPPSPAGGVAAASAAASPSPAATAGTTAPSPSAEAVAAAAPARPLAPAGPTELAETSAAAAPPVSAGTPPVAAPSMSAETSPAATPSVSAGTLPATTPSVPAKTPSAATPSMSAETPPAAPPTAQPSQRPPAVRQIVLRAVGNTWVRVRQNGGRVLITRSMKAGDTWPVPSEPNLILDTGNADSLDLDVDGVATRLTGAKGGVIHDVPLNGNLLGSGAAVRVAR
jgi:cytoskeleton protein RodZ